MSKCQLRWYRSAESTGRQSQLPALHSEMAKQNDGQRRTVDRLEGVPDVRFHHRHYLIKASLHCHTAQHSRSSLAVYTDTNNKLFEACQVNSGKRHLKGRQLSGSPLAPVTPDTMLQQCSCCFDGQLVMSNESPLLLLADVNSM